MMFSKALATGFLAAALVASAATVQADDVFNMPPGQTSLQFVTVGDPGNAADPATGNLYGSVAYTYQIGKCDVTLSQYTAFLNAVAKTDTYGLYNTNMATDFPTNYSTNIGISRSGSSGSYSYSVTGNGNMPVFDVTWGGAARFCNWLQTGTTETGAYTLNGATLDAALMAITRNANATYVIPSENEWYKAAYYKGGSNNAGYWFYPTQSNTTPSNVLSATGTNNANFWYWDGGFTDPTNYLTPVGAFADSPGPYGTFDMGGDVWQWNEANIDGAYRGLRGGGWDFGYDELVASAANGIETPTYEGNFYNGIYAGFRVAFVPEPGSITLLVAGALSLVAYGWRRRR
jgi:formylglycine-generating enzyme required for sulfatase activity